MLLTSSARWRAASLTSLLAVGLTACGSSAPRSEPTAPATAATAAPSSTTTGGQAAPPPGPGSVTAQIDLVGLWTSPKCGARGYVRNIELIDGGRFKSEDRVSPCPPQVACVWSGIVSREGTWTHAPGSGGPGTVTLAVDKDAKGPGVGELPGSLELPGAELVEVQGSERCSYTKR